MLSNIFHKREVPEIHSVSGITIMEPEDIVKGEEELRERIDSFKYSEVINLVRSDSDMIASYAAAPNNYEKLHFYRMIFDDKTSLIESDVVKKFINEAFHIENNYIYQLNPCEYQIIPNYIIDECNQHIELLKKDS
ncbi:MAG: hypothetical protein AMQ74_01256 [Candidatus Methanofastidiosum methylothiophilum]|uniref:Uncharacterized protein n=1 Tax=Candidatus Methanofastidiosum methylothiophilum TaxID=1705564 RepID=A0A150IZM6_9EURY|nr:MAG: hypothetical protein AMQ74_01256 [Candidatus Methanofastidiosum methylthiophilus]